MLTINYVKRCDLQEKKFNKLPKHIGYIIDGNGRWAKSRGLPRSMGHSAGLKTLKKIIKLSFELGIRYVSIYAFSTENWNRPDSEIQGLIDLFKKYLKGNSFVKDYPNTKLNIMGDYTKFPKELVDAANKTIEMTKFETQFVLNLGINYSGKDEIVMAVNSIIKDGLTEVTRDVIDNYLYTKGQPEPDFIIRTSGEQRLSNFMMWQAAYSELYFPDTLWPDFNKKELYKALKEFEKRNRRFGSIKEEG
ncbi:MAG: di-trans,poly-cis-decaprenylcistransferase [Clostridia bacterium]|nr:di-trans,poly-cis-decaprenylcistransferase [Clostridia bacterium]